MKTDADLRRDVMAELEWDSAVDATAIGVAVKDGIVTLSGHLGTYAQKWAVEKALRRIAGVKAIALELDVKLAAEHQRSDTEIAHAAELAIRWSSLVPPQAVRLVVEKGWIRLQGEVEWEYQRNGVEKVLRDLKGVVGISNEITIRHKPAPGDVALRIQEALSRQALRAARHLRIDIDDGVVTLRGTVHSWPEREAVQGAAASAPGVRRIVNELNVG